MPVWTLPLLGVALVGAVAAFLTNWEQSGNPNLPAPTMGGQQVWADEFYHVGWRIQRNILTDHYRLLDPDNFRQAWGTYEECLKAFNEERERQTISYEGKPLVLLVRGLGGTGLSFREMKEALEDDGYHVAIISYPTTRQGIHAHAVNIQVILDRLEGVTDMFVVAHSMGGLVMRQVLARGGPWTDRIEVKGLVMIATPNQGSQLAHEFRDLGAFETATTEAGQDLLPDFAKGLPAVTIPHCLIVGTLNNGKGLNPLVDGDDDGVVAVSEVLLHSTDDVLYVEDNHNGLLSNPDSIAGIRRFLSGGRCSGVGS